MSGEITSEKGQSKSVGTGDGSAFWPCPHNCHLWVRGITLEKAMTLHHPNCEHANATLIDVWRVTIDPGDKGGCICGSEAEAREMAGDDPAAPMTITKEKMHREIFENLPDFAGF